MRRVVAVWSLVAGCGFQITPTGGVGVDSAIDGTSDDATDATDAPAPDAMIDGPPFVPFIRRINIGGLTHNGTDFPGAWAADPGVCGGAMIWTVAGGINQTVDDALFVNHAYLIPTLTCAIPNIPPGTYAVTMLFGPTYYGAGCNDPTPQIFSIQLEGTMVATNYNLSAETQGCVMSPGTGHPVAKTFMLAITDGTLNIVEQAPAGETAILSAIQLIQQP